jgi:hypothetical protein
MDKDLPRDEERRDRLCPSFNQIAHFFAHNGAEECSRNDALFLLTTLAGLLAERLVQPSSEDAAGAQGKDNS